MIWRKWLPWRWILKHVAKAEGFIYPVAVLAKLQRFAQPSEVLAPVELLRMGLVLQARGLINSQAIQHNLDWVWPYWVEQQFDPQSASLYPACLFHDPYQSDAPKLDCRRDSRMRSNAHYGSKRSFDAAF